MDVVRSYGGWIEVVVGPMFSGKTEELLRRLRRARIAKQKVQVFKPKIDDRYHETRVVSHSSIWMDAIVVSNSEEMMKKLDPQTQVIGIDEVQFFDSELIEQLEALARKGLRIICAGLDLDYKGRPFGIVPELLSISEYVTKTLAICMQCGSPAGRSQKLVGGDEQVDVGAAESYEARCRQCHVPWVEVQSETLSFEEEQGQASWH